MGCQNSKEPQKVPNAAVRGDAQKNGNDLGAAPPALDPRVPLKPRQLFLLKKSWKGIKRNMEATGVEMFISLFRQNADLKNLFDKFQTLQSSDDMRGSEALEQHGNLVMGVFDECITNFDDVDHVESVCTRVGQIHSHFNGFNPNLFWNMEQPFLEALRIILTDRYTDQMDVIYQLTVKFILASLNRACMEASSS